MPNSPTHDADLAERILDAARSGQGTHSVSSESSPIHMSVDGRIARLRPEGEATPKGSCAPPYSSWGD